MSKTNQYSKFDKILWGAGQAPTIPPSENKTDGTWAITDLALGEVCINTIDDRIWYRSTGGIFELNTDSISNNLYEGVISYSGNQVTTIALNGLNDVIITPEYGNYGQITGITSTQSATTEHKTITYNSEGKITSWDND